MTEQLSKEERPIREDFDMESVFFGDLAFNRALVSWQGSQLESQADRIASLERALTDIAEMENESDEWDGTVKYEQARIKARDALERKP